MIRNFHRTNPGILAAVTVFLAAAIFLGACRISPENRKPALADAEKFITDTEDMLMELAAKGARAYWVQANFITEDTQAIAAQASQEQMEVDVRLAQDIKRFDGLELPPELARKFKILKLSLFSLSDPVEREEIARLATELEGDYGKGRACFDDGRHKGKCLEIGEVEQIFAYSRDPEELRIAWKAWHDGVGTPIRDRYERLIQLQNKGARELGFRDMGAMWRSNYDMTPEAFETEVDRLWNQVRPFYESLHAYTRSKLIKQYGLQAVTDEGLIRADLFGNIWAQEWSNIYPLAAPTGAGRGYDLTAILRQKKINELGMVRYGENFFKSLGFAPLPQSFWDRSLFVKPRDREVVCHASAWDMDSRGDLRLKMCIQIDAEDFVTIHHELGHNFYQRAYLAQPFLFKDGANDGFHEAIGDTIALSITPDYLKQVGLLSGNVRSDDIGLLLHQAMDKIAFLPFGLMIDQWRWKVMDGSYPPDRFNSGWWELREKYQGIAPPVVRTELDFDPGAKYHVPANVPYTRYFLAHILQFQFYRALAREAGCTGPLHLCSFYGNKEAGAKLNAMLEMGRSKPWPDALEAMTGEREIDGSAVMEYFAPLKQWLDRQNAAAGTTPGWTLPKDPLSPSFGQR